MLNKLEQKTGPPMMYRALSLFVMFAATVFLLLFHLHGTSSQEEESQETCTTKEMRRAVVNRQLADLDCDNYTCGIH